MQAKQILIGRFVECQSIKKVGGRRSVEELYQALFFVSPFRRNVSPSETKIEPDRRLIQCRKCIGSPVVWTDGCTDVRTDGHVTTTSLPKFFGLIDYQISLAMELR